jgi:hypothetical protein
MLAIRRKPYPLTLDALRTENDALGGHFTSGSGLNVVLIVEREGMTFKH